MLVLVWTGVFLALYVYFLTNALRAYRVSSDAIFIRVDEGDPRIPESAIRYFDHVAGQVAPLGFSEVVRFIQPGAVRAMTAFGAAFMNERRSDSALAVVVVRPSASVTTSTCAFEFCSVFSDDREVDTTNAVTPIQSSRPHEKRIQQIPDMADLTTLYRVHRGLVDSLGDSLKKAPSDPDAKLERLRSGFKTDVAAQAKSGRIFLSPDGRAYQLSFKARLMAVWSHAFPGKHVVAMRIRRNARRRLRELDLPQDYELQSKKFPQWTAASRKAIVFGQLLLLGVFTAYAVVSFYGFQGGTAVRRFVGIGLAVSLLWVPLLTRRIKAQQKGFYCSNCGTVIKAKDALCSLCGEGSCAQCGYNLFGNQTGMCPECGTAIVIEVLA